MFPNGDATDVVGVLEVIPVGLKIDVGPSIDFCDMSLDEVGGFPKPVKLFVPAGADEVVDVFALASEAADFGSPVLNNPPEAFPPEPLSSLNSPSPPVPVLAPKALEVGGGPAGVVEVPPKLKLGAEAVGAGVVKPSGVVVDPNKVPGVPPVEPPKMPELVGIDDLAGVCKLPKPLKVVDGIGDLFSLALFWLSPEKMLPAPAGCPNILPELELLVAPNRGVVSSAFEPAGGFPRLPNEKVVPPFELFPAPNRLFPWLDVPKSELPEDEDVDAGAPKLNFGGSDMAR